VTDENRPAPNAADAFFVAYQQRVWQLVERGLREGHARQLAAMETLIAQWPPNWGDDFVALIYGDFHAPTTALEFPAFRITIEPEKIANSPIRSLCVLRARVKISDKSVGALIDAAARIDTLLGVLSVLNWGNSGIGWWSHMTHDLGGGVVLKMEPDRVQRVAEAIGRLRDDVARKVRAALHWIREPRGASLEHRNDVLRVYSGYWNAFECLVDAVLILRPLPKQSSADKQARLEEIMAERCGKVDADVVIRLSQVVNPGLVDRATHALRVCFSDQASKYVDECFKMKPE
jgi:hypothetical protein